MFSLAHSCRCIGSSRISISVRRYASAPESHNQAIVKMLRRHREEEEASPNRNGYKVRAFDNAIKVLNRLDHPIRSAGEALSLKGVGDGIAMRISQFLVENDNSSDTSDERIKARKDSLRRMLKVELEAIPGIGQVMAEKLIDAGLTNIAELRKRKYSVMLGRGQKVGVQYLEHLDKPVSREEAETVAEFIRQNISSKYEIIIVGSYRRGAVTSSDIDIIILHPNHVHVPLPHIAPPPSLHPRVLNKAIRVDYVRHTVKESSPLYNDVLPTLEERGLLPAYLMKGSKKWQGIVRIPEKDEQGNWASRQARLEGIEKGLGTFKRLDLHMVPMKSRGAAMISLTGDAELNRHVRLKAIKQGMHLNEFGLWRWITNSSLSTEEKEAGDKNEEAEGVSEGHGRSGFWQLIRATTEDEIFEELGMDFIEPHKRNFAFINKRGAAQKIAGKWAS